MFPKIKRKDWSVLQTDCPQCLKALNNYYHLTLGSLYTVTQRNWPYQQTKLQTIFLSWCSILSVQFSHSVMSNTLRAHGLQIGRLPCPSPTPGASSNSSPSSWWCHPTISFSAVPSSNLQSFPASGSFHMSHTSHQVAKVLKFQLRHQSFKWIFRSNLL